MADRLLDSDHFAERMAVWWLDPVRYADSSGYHSDNPVNVSPYRDWVIRSFHQNKRFDRFTIEQVAGDLLPDASRETRVASAYNRLILSTEEGGAQPKQYESKYLTDRVKSIGTTWLAQTLMCSRVPRPQVRSGHGPRFLFARRLFCGYRGTGRRITRERQDSGG